MFKTLQCLHLAFCECSCYQYTIYVSILLSSSLSSTPVGVSNARFVFNFSRLNSFYGGVFCGVHEAEISIQISALAGV